MNCNHIEKQIVKYIDGELEESDFDLIKSHIDSCDSCNDFYLKTLATDEKLNLYETITPNKSWTDFNKRLSRERITKFLPTWAIAASILIAAVFGTSLGLYNNIDKNDKIFASYMNLNNDYISVVEKIN